MSIRVLALNDGLCETSFFIENDTTCYSTEAIIYFLSQKNFILRHIHVNDIPNNDTKAIDAFNIINWWGTAMSREEAFDYLWNISEEG